MDKWSCVPLGLCLECLILTPFVTEQSLFQPEEEPKEEAAPAKPVVGIIYPPPEVRNIVDKTASFVARSVTLVVALSPGIFMLLLFSAAPEAGAGPSSVVLHEGF